jgi:hypothetical protein
MTYKSMKGDEINGHLDIFVAYDDEIVGGKTKTTKEILIHGDPEGLRSFAKLLNDLADLNQEEVDQKYLPAGAREHYLLRPDLELAKSSDQVVVGRLDAKGTGAFYDRFIPKKVQNKG